jgi:hypothetical protein
MNPNFQKNCPTCNKKITYSSNRLLKQSIKRDSKCQECNKKNTSDRFKNKPKTNEHKLKLSKAKEKYKEIYRQIMIEINHNKKGKKYTEEHKKNISLAKIGDKNPAKRKDVREKIRDTTINNYLNSKTINYFTKGNKKTTFNGTTLYYQGLYEFDFLNKFYNQLQIENGKIFKYIDNDGYERKYISDFYLPQFNLIIERK